MVSVVPQVKQELTLPAKYVSNSFAVISGISPFQNFSVIMSTDPFKVPKNTQFWEFVQE
jgi:hypothetical protein